MSIINITQSGISSEIFSRVANEGERIRVRNKKGKSIVLVPEKDWRKFEKAGRSSTLRIRPPYARTPNLAKPKTSLSKSKYSIEYLRSLSPAEQAKIFKKAVMRVRKDYCKGGNLAGFEACGPEDFYDQSA
ncbi:MAG: hypothetical protein NTX50_10480 [Candidatus Sumerlaeota bacterium]|nr:hypothetical protein [Candidatus Sumerlaeota bacterium]